MFSAAKIVTIFAVFAALFGAMCAADVPKDSPFLPNSSGKAATSPSESLEFAGVSTVGKKTMINLYDGEQKHGFWVEVGATSDGVTVLKYDSAHDQVTVRRDGVEKTLPLRAAGAVASGPVNTLPIVPPVAPPVAMMPQPAPNAADATTAPAAPMDAAAQKRARQEEEARMLVSDLLEIGMAQRKAYEEAQRKAAAARAGQPAGAATAQSNATPAEPAQSGATPQATSATAPTTPSGG